MRRRDLWLLVVTLLVALFVRVTDGPHGPAEPPRHAGATVAAWSDGSETGR